MQNIEIRRPKFSDIEALNLFFTLVVSDTYAKEGLADLTNDIENEIKVKNRHLMEDLKSEGKDRYFLIALEKEKIIGTIEYSTVSELIVTCTKGALNNLVEVGTVFVHPEYQRQGIGTLLWNMMYLTFINRDIPEFCLDSGYTRAQKVWIKKFGQADYIIKDHWGPGFDHMIWKRSIKNIPILFRI